MTPVDQTAEPDRAAADRLPREPKLKKRSRDVRGEIATAFREAGRVR